MRIKTQLFLLLSLLGISSIAQERLEDNMVGKSILLQSEIMNDTRTLKVYLPDSYEDSGERYPVLYLLDGQRYFLHGVSIHQTLTEFKQTPEFIVVGIPRHPSDRNRVYTSLSAQYLEFIEKEVIGHIEAHFNVSEHRMLFGWAFGGGFVFETMIEKPGMFDTYITASPFPLVNKLVRIDSMLTQHPDFDKQLYFTSETTEGQVREGTQALRNLLTEKGNSDLSWTFKELASEEHRSTPFATLYHGVRQTFPYYPELQFNSLEDFQKAGGINYIKAYYQKRAEEYGFAPEPSDWTMFSVTRNAMRSNDFEQFDALFTEFNKTNFIERLSVSRACSVAEFYRKNNRLQSALELYQLLAEKHPASEQPLNGLGDTYKAMNEPERAALYYEKAKKLAE